MESFKKLVYRAINRVLPARSRLRAFMMNMAVRPYGCRLAFVDDRIECIHGSRKIVLRRKNEIYFYDMCRYFDRYHSQVAPKRQDGFEVVDYSQPGLHLVTDCKLEFHFPGMAEGRAAFDNYVHHARPKEGDIVFDCGAYSGVTAYFLSKCVGPNGKVVAFEPDDANYESLLKNIRLHGLTNVIPIKKGVWSSSGKLRFHSDGSLGAAVAGLSDRPGAPPAQEIEVVTFADAVKELGLPRVDFVKMDVEGAEIEICRGAAEWIKQQRPRFAIASYHVVDGEPTHHFLDGFLPSLGMRVESQVLRTGSASVAEHGEMTTWAWY